MYFLRITLLIQNFQWINETIVYEKKILICHCEIVNEPIYHFKIQNKFTTKVLVNIKFVQWYHDLQFLKYTIRSFHLVGVALKTRLKLVVSLAVAV